jgi:hypothetical protein
MAAVKILVANLGSTSLKYRLFDFSNGEERLLARGGFERVTDYAKVIEDCLAEMKNGGWIRDESGSPRSDSKPLWRAASTVVCASMNAC